MFYVEGALGRLFMPNRAPGFTRCTIDAEIALAHLSVSLVRQKFFQEGWSVLRQSRVPEENFVLRFFTQ